MANILENFNQNQLELIVDNDGVSYIFTPTDGDYIRMSVFNTTGTLVYQFFSNKRINIK